MHGEQLRWSAQECEKISRARKRASSLSLKGSCGSRTRQIARAPLLTHTVEIELSSAATPLSVPRSASSAAEDRRLCVAVFRRLCPCSTVCSLPSASDMTYRATPHRRAEDRGNA